MVRAQTFARWMLTVVAAFCAARGALAQSQSSAPAPAPAAATNGPAPNAWRRRAELATVPRQSVGRATLNTVAPSKQFTRKPPLAVGRSVKKAAAKPRNEQHDDHHHHHGRSVPLAPSPATAHGAAESNAAPEQKPVAEAQHLPIQQPSKHAPLDAQKPGAIRQVAAEQASQDDPTVSYLQQQLQVLSAARQSLEQQIIEEPANEEEEETGRLEKNLRQQIRAYAEKIAAQRLKQQQQKQAMQQAPATDTDAAAQSSQGSDHPPAELPETDPVLDIVKGEPVAPLELAQVLFRLGHDQQALAAYQRVDIADLDPEERLLVQYMSATCLRKLGQLQQAETVYREIANAKTKSEIVDFARWQLNAMQWRREMSARLEEVRQRRLALSAAK